MRVGDFVEIDGKKYDVKDMMTAKSGKHGAAKVFIKAVDAETGAIVEKVLPADFAIKKAEKEKNSWFNSDESSEDEDSKSSNDEVPKV